MIGIGQRYPHLMLEWIIPALEAGFILIFMKLILYCYNRLRLHFKLQSVPHRRSHFLLGDLRDAWKDDWSDPSRTITRRIHRFHEEFGEKKICISWNFWTPILWVFKHEGASDVFSKKNYLLKGNSYKYLRPWIGEGLLTSISTKWHARRKLITPAFHFDILSSFSSTMISHSQEFLSFVAKFCEKGQNWIKLDERLSLFTLNVLFETAMGLTGDDLKELRSDYVEAVRTLEKHITKRYINFLWRFDCIYYRSETGKKVKEALKTVRKFSRKVIQHRIEYLKRCEENSPDDQYSPSSNDDSYKKRRKHALMDQLISAYLDQNELSIKDSEDIREEIDTFMFAGHDTTAVTIGWIIFILGNNLEIQEKLYQELESCFQSGGNDIDHTKIISNEYLDACIKEGMRLISPVPVIGKTLPEDTKICGYDIPKGTSLFMFLFFMHRDPRIYPNPLEFKPDRFLYDHKKSPFSYIPFSAGPRNCIGQKFALQEIKIFTALLVNKFKFSSKIKIEDVQYVFEMVTRATDPLEIKFEKR